MHFGFALDLSDIDLLNIDSLDQRYTHLDLLDTDIPSKHFVCLQDVLKTSSRHVFKTSSRYVFKTSWRRLPRNNFSSSNFSFYAEDVLKTFQNMSQRRLEDQQMFAGKNLQKLSVKIFLKFYYLTALILLIIKTAKFQTLQLTAL